MTSLTPLGDPSSSTPVGPPPPALQQPAPVVPGRTLGIVGFALSFFAVLNLAGLVLFIIALVRSKRAGSGNGFALAGIIIASIGIAIAVLIAALTIPMLVDAALTCQRLGEGVHQVGNATYTCTPTSFRVFHSM